MGHEIQHCTNCVLPISYPGITFDEHGVCNFCRVWKPENVRGEVTLRKAIEPHRHQSGRKYDCVIGLSGGRDSSFTAYYAVKELGLRAIAYTYDNGFMPDETKNNAARAAEALGIEHFIDKNTQFTRHQRPMLSVWTRHPSPAMVPFLCAGCTGGYFQGVVGFAQKNNVRLFISGGGEPERSFAEDLLNPRSMRVIDKSDRVKRRAALFLGFMRELLTNPNYLLMPGLLASFNYEFKYRYSFSFKRNDIIHVQLFRYIEWNESRIMSTIENEFGWQKPSHSKASWRSDCTIHILKQYLYKEMLGFTKNDELLSNMIRANMITRQAALERLENDNQISHDFLDEFLDGMGIPITKIDAALEIYRHKSGGEG